jgi:hypothetical protein
MDPVDGKRPLAWQEHESWRLWLTNRLAAALLSAAGTVDEKVAFALERVRHEGVDTTTWIPDDPRNS